MAKDTVVMARSALKPLPKAEGYERGYDELPGDLHAIPQEPYGPQKQIASWWSP